ncbi:TonB-dependent receptor [Yeosuana aromativorans]|uniref:TonB-dependent receptor n=1 Tax=Yeosuana aromativorans TaxID=288019 RepID=A0A8J3FLB6_9FLAO|nr:TonB-dependent receptor plug domain-containing protein [Yeosuana aromativorans]GGK33323.1 TonB-dependent receptor [Yeosuana aromativorans]
MLCLNAQTVQKDKLPLTDVLKAIEATYNISFSYADATVKNKSVTVPKDNLTLKETLNYLKAETGLDFQMLDDHFVVIREFEHTDEFIIPQRLEEVVVTNYLTKGITQLNDGTTTIKPETFGILPGLIEPDVLQTIQALPGIYSVDETVSNINVRGGTHDQNLFLWDGIKMYQSGHFFGLISAFNPYTTKQVNISKNGTRAKYGDGISSVIDMQLSNTVDNEFKAGAGFNLINADVYAKIPLSKKTELQVSTRRSITDLVVTPTYDQYFKRIFQDSDLTNNQNGSYSISKNEDFYFYDITAKFLYDITPTDRIRVHFLNVNNDLNYDEQSTVNDNNEALNSKLSQQNLATGITYTKDWNTRLSTTAQIYVTNYNLDATNFDVINNQRLIQENKVTDNSAKIDVNFKANHNIKFNGGYQFSEVGVSNLEDVNNPVFRSYIKEVIRSHAVYAETSLLSNNAKTNLKFGTRINYHQKFNLFLVEPRLSFSQRFLNDFRFEVLGEFKSQTTSQIIDLQNDFLGIEKRRWILSNNDDIPIIKSKQISTGIHYNKNQLLISAEAYIKKVDGITTRSQGFQNQYQFVNAIGSYQIQGVDFLVNKQFNDLISTWLSYSYSKNNYTFQDLNNGEPFPNNTDIRHALTVAGTYTYNQFKIALGLNWHTGKPTTQPIAGNESTDGEINYEAPNSSNLKDYLRADCSATYDFDFSAKTHATVGASVWNVTNKKNVINSYYTIDDDNMVSKVENQSLGITPNVSFRLQF